MNYSQFNNDLNINGENLGDELRNELLDASLNVFQGDVTIKGTLTAQEEIVQKITTLETTDGLLELNIDQTANDPNVDLGFLGKYTDTGSVYKKGIAFLTNDDNLSILKDIDKDVSDNIQNYQLSNIRIAPATSLNNATNLLQVQDMINNINLSEYVDISTNQTVAGVKTFSDKMIIENTDASFQSLLRFESERPWEFRTNNVGAGTSLELYSSAPAKTFKITTLTESSGDQNIFGFSESLNTSYTPLDLNDNDIQNIDKAEIKEIELLQGVNGTKAGSIEADGLNNIIYTNSVVDKEHRFYVRDSGVNSGILFIGPETITARRDITMDVNSSIKNATDVQSDKLTLIRPDGRTDTGWFEQFSDSTRYFNMTGSGKHRFFNNVSGFSAESFSIANDEVRSFRKLFMINGNDIDMNTLGKIVDSAEVESKKLTLIKPNDGDKTVAGIGMVDNYVRYDSLINSSFGGHRFYVNNGSADVMALQITRSHIDTNYKLKMGYNKIEELAEPTANTDAATKSYVDNAVAAGGGGSSFNTDISLNGNDILDVGNCQVDKLVLIRPDGSLIAGSIQLFSNETKYVNMSGGTSSKHNFYCNNVGSEALRFTITDTEIKPTVPLNMNSNRITNVSNPVSANDAATKSYVDNNYAIDIEFLSLTCQNFPLLSTYSIGSFNIQHTGQYVIDYTVNIRQNEGTLTDRNFAVLLTAVGSTGNKSSQQVGFNLTRTGSASSSIGTASVNFKWRVEYTTIGSKVINMDVGSRSGSGTPFEFYGVASITKVNYP